MATTETLTRGRAVGSAVLRKEDRKLVTGHGQFIDNINLPGQTWLAVVRSPYAHARIGRVDLAEARELPGVVAAFSGAELAAEWAGSLPCAWPVTEEIRMPPHFPLVSDEARHVGDGVAVVVAETRALAQDAAELVEVEYEPLPAVADVAKALDTGAPLVHDDLGTNECFVWKLDAGEVEQAFADADVTVKRSYRQQRLIPVAMEPRGALAQELQGTGELTLWSSTQIPHIARLTLAGVVGVPEARLRVIAPDVGGGFGSKLDVYAEEALVLALARRLHRPVKWIEDRSEGFTATIHGRDALQEIELAATSDGKITAVRVRLVSAMGAYLQLVTPG
ncbi:MAG TPA: molybdopterin cofactor-binding domain-containing protein, partial [Gaiellaceae bacterium]|nr:molybdopterin cofactor-binding domain-containing protein [Gaiellaceae bacterium]